MKLIEQKINRYDKIQLSLDNLTYATREQLQIINDLSGDRNARRILLDMEREGYIKSVRHEKKIYYAAYKRLQKSEIQHTLMRNDLYIKLGIPSDWRKEVPIRRNGEVLLIPDAMFTKNSQYHFVEIDNKQSMRINLEKIEKYSELFKMIFRQHKHHPTLIWYTLSEIRKEKLKLACEENKVKHEIY